jgi:hypothetical protein
MVTKHQECLERQNVARKTEARTQVTQADETIVVGGNMEVLQQEQGENVMFRRVLLKPYTNVVEEPEQRKKSFKTKCKIQDKCCHLVIDGRSTENLVSIEVMEKWKLKIIPHPNPYKVSWLKRGQHHTVTHICLLSFQIGKFSEQVLCYIVEMDACPTRKTMVV